ncbi:hypothetical protein FHR89_000084 [Cellulomonas uda]|uniref:Uncharacterized protein n=1 Tax=Cellulomonas uda TaxID=1714 RepID=A0A4Y3KDK6_CELUD|nr:hypothetical protein [Cellulomonas uda]GEA82043.1 hypothetical protein CUD01_24870 [Cellulomonas uda]
MRIETASGTFVGGWFGENSFVSTYPEPHRIGHRTIDWRSHPW